MDVDNAYATGFTNYHEYVFAKMSKLITDMEWMHAAQQRFLVFELKPKP